MSELSQLIKQRGNIKARLTLFQKYLAPLMDSKETSTLRTNELSLRLNKMRDLSSNFEEVQLQIEMLDEDSDKQLKEREVTENLFFSLIAQAQSLLEFLEKSNNTETSSNISKGGRHLKLPPLKITPFNGDPNKWLTFRDSYLSLIHNNEDIDDISKFHYLKSYLEGAATSVIQSVSVSSNNYCIAWNLLCERYNNKRLLVNEHLKCLFSIEPLQKETDSGIRNLIDTLSKNLSALNSLDEPTDKWDTIIIYMASMKLDSVTAGKWEEFRSNKDSPTLDEFYSFLRRQATVLETTNARKPSIFEKRHSVPKVKSFTVSCVDSPPSKRCGICKQEHRLYECNKFKCLPVDERIAKTSLLKLCTNCLRSGHQSYQCRLGGCRICRRKHNTLLHKPQVQQTPQSNTQSVHTTPSTAHSKTNSTENSPNSDHDSTASRPSTVVSMTAASNNQALLSTALVKVTHKGKTVKMRALLDCGSQSSFISDRAQRKIGSHRTRDHHRNVSGLGNTILNITEHCTVQLHSLNTTFSAAIKCFVIPQITDNLPHATVHTKDLGIPDNIHLADPMFYQPAEIDILLGADIFWDLIGTGRISLGPQRPVLQETHLGWIVAGPMGGKYYNSNNSKVSCHFSRDISKQLAKFWELEEIPSNGNHTQDNHCERLFTQTTHREDDGRFCVQIPLKESTEVLGESYNIAEKRFLQLERNLKKKPEVQELYRNFIHEYERLGHMTEIPKPPFGCYLPHHAVIRESSDTTKLRVVFDASAKTTSGISFNDIQHVGPVVQDDLFSILLRYRQHKYVVSADVEKMYRQILVHPSQRVLQLILWRDDPSQPLKIFQLNTVTYGTASAPFLSTRCLLQLSKECNDKVISQSIKEDYYVDDYLSGASSEAELRHKIQSVTSTLSTARLPLRKFRTNVPSIFDNDSNTSMPKNLDLSSQSSVLGLKWDPPKDILWFPVNIQLDERVTKRTILSNSAKLFDPLGLLGPCTIIPKILLQKLWLTKLDWDDPVSHVVRKEWLAFVNNLNAVSKIEIPRCVIISEPEVIELHSFSDASQTAYASAIYLRSIDGAGQVLVRLLCAKTKVAPVKSTTIPRLELCGALLSARLSTKVLTALRCKVHNVFHWTDSTVVLCWLSSQANDLKPFVANRVGEVQELTASASWRHVPGTQNPADLASRGLNPRLIKSSTLWWEGPPFLRKNPCEWPQMGNFKSMPNEEVPERKSYSKLHTTNSLLTTNHTHVQPTPDMSRLVNFERHSKFTTLHRSIAYVLRFINNLRKNHPKTTGHLTQNELKSSLHTLIKLHQKECFSKEIKILNSKQNLPSNSHVLSLSPFIDENGILCVGGRIQNSNETYERKHPILLDTNHNFTKLLFTHRHNQLLHGGPQLLLSDLRNNYWPLRGRVLARSTVNNCRLCKLMKAKGFNPIMGNLPASRVSPSLPFQTSGVDFAGPFLITDRKGRGCKITKCYLCLFICFATKALHLEVASDLSTDVFILCLRRFISRRGKPLELYCDNGTNFVGANNEITAFLRSSNESISGFAADEGIKFWFSPAYSPHFGGLWEAGVKSAKFHVTRILGDKHLTFEELSTIFTQIEAILNSRPLTPLSSDPNDLNPLTPAHFLIGRPLTSLPSENLLDANPRRLDRYRWLETMRQHFWERWRNEYLSELQQKTKWRVKQRGLQEGELVVIKEANVPPLKWRMARVHKLYPGSDGIARVADVYTAKGIIRRGVHNLCSLPDSSS
ncbi:uncharacterized protein LOC123721194 [Papilio machaon]|uniref:uncharacterized protein LOC123721194 n=1 Tax=Papilio machaon TaxID=76193 RepID=UPI001E662D42|nr:uncharacterized protein LOC123721194 [Papilio machaon]